MKLSVITDELDHDLDVALPAASDLGIEWVALRSVRKENVMDFSTAEMDEVAQQIASHAMRVSCLMSPLFKGSLPEAGNKTSATDVATAAHQAQRVDTSLVRVMSFRKQDPSVEKQAFAVMTASLNTADLAGLVPCLENEYGGHIDTLESLSRQWPTLSTACPTLMVALDPVNHIRAGGSADLVSLLDANLMSNVRDIHIKDINQFGEYVPIGRGTLPWPDIFTHLRRIDYAGFITIEAHLDQDPDRVRQSIETVQRWIG